MCYLNLGLKLWVALGCHSDPTSYAPPQHSFHGSTPAPQAGVPQHAQHAALGPWTCSLHRTDTFPNTALCLDPGFASSLSLNSTLERASPTRCRCQQLHPGLPPSTPYPLPLGLYCSPWHFSDILYMLFIICWSSTTNKMWSRALPGSCWNPFMGSMRSKSHMDKRSIQCARQTNEFTIAEYKKFIDEITDFTQLSLKKMPYGQFWSSIRRISTVIWKCH